mmetsp:Transcript_40059/g.99278  ORF Transcript_40059/g.99278 Transcript_40059/m.99278 type:complete len:238 (-) Transcript_40059:130-843(-)
MRPLSPRRCRRALRRPPPPNSSGPGLTPSPSPTLVPSSSPGPAATRRARLPRPSTLPWRLLTRTWPSTATRPSACGLSSFASLPAASSSRLSPSPTRPTRPPPPTARARSWPVTCRSSSPPSALRCSAGLPLPLALPPLLFPHRRLRRPWPVSSTTSPTSAPRTCPKSPVSSAPRSSLLSPPPLSVAVSRRARPLLRSGTQPPVRGAARSARLWRSASPPRHLPAHRFPRPGLSFFP